MYIYAMITNIHHSVNNAGYGQAATLENASLEKSRQLFETNFFGAMHLTQKFIPSMKRNKSGHIIFISSTVTTFGKYL